MKCSDEEEQLTKNLKETGQELQKSIKGIKEITVFPLSANQKAKLTACGLTTVDHIINLKESELSILSGLNLEDAKSVIWTVRESKIPILGQSAADILRHEQSISPIVTFSQSLDDLLGGGVSVGQVTEVCGVPGSGKTQLSLQLSASVQLPESLGGLAGEVIFVDTEGSFVTDRIVEIINATIDHCKQIANLQQDLGIDIKELRAETFLSKIHYQRCLDYKELLASVHLLKQQIKNNPKVKLVIVDSIAFHFRYDFDDMMLRTRILTMLGQQLMELATAYQIAVVLTNQMTTKVRTSDDSQMIPALGDSWGHVCTTRIILQWKDKQRLAILYKSPSKPRGQAPFQITDGGIRDVVENTDLSFEDVQENNPSKRQRIT